MPFYRIRRDAERTPRPRECVNLVFFTTLPVVASPFYLKLLAAISRTFGDGEKLPFVLAASDPKTLWKELNKATRVAVKNI